MAPRHCLQEQQAHIVLLTAGSLFVHAAGSPKMFTSAELEERYERAPRQRLQEQKAAAQPEQGGLPVKTLEGEVVPQLRGVNLQVSPALNTLTSQKLAELLQARRAAAAPGHGVVACGDPSGYGGAPVVRGGLAGEHRCCAIARQEHTAGTCDSIGPACNILHQRCLSVDI